MTATETDPKPAPKKGKASNDWGSPARLKGEKNLTKTATKKWYWCGTYPTCPTAFVHAGAATFAAVTIDKKMTPEGNQVDTPMLGSLMYLSKPEVQAIAETISRSVIVFHEESDPEVDMKYGTDMLHQRRRRGIIVRRKTQEEVDAIIKNGGPDMTYTPSALDEPLGDHIWMMPCHDQDAPGPQAMNAQGVKPVTETGIAWPD